MYDEKYRTPLHGREIKNLKIISKNIPHSIFYLGGKYAQKILRFWLPSSLSLESKQKFPFFCVCIQKEIFVNRFSNIWEVFF